MENTYEKLNDQNKKLLDDYEKHRLKVLDHNPSTVETQKLQLSKYLYYLNGKNPKQIAQEELINFLDQYKPSTQANLITVLKPFYRWMFNVEETHELPDFIRKLKRNTKINGIEYRERVITEEEYQRMLDCANGAMYRAILETLYLFGVRVSELLSMTPVDVKYDGELTTITIRDSKTIPRDVDHKGRAEQLMKYVESHQLYKGQKDKPLWVGYKGKILTRMTVLNNIHLCAKKAGIDRRVTNHDFRHTSITRDKDKGIPITHIETKHGLRHGSPMMGRYDHNKSQDYKNYLRERKEETEVTYETLKKQKERLEQKHEKEIKELKDSFENLHYEKDKIALAYEERIRKMEEKMDKFLGLH